MTIVAIIQARMGSTRLPKKVLHDICGKTMLSRTAGRTQSARLVDMTVVATTDKPGDDAIVEKCRREALPCFRGNEDNVLDRYYQAAIAYNADAIVRVTSDCPLVDPGEIDNVIRNFKDQNADFASNFVERTYPRGLDTEAISFETLTRVRQEAAEEYQRVHVTPYIYENPDKFQIVSVTNAKDLSKHRWTVDTPEDLEFVRAIYSRLADPERFDWLDVLRIVESEPALRDISRHVRQKPVKEG